MTGLPRLKPAEGIIELFSEITQEVDNKGRSFSKQSGLALLARASSMLDL